MTSLKLLWTGDRDLTRNLTLTLSSLARSRGPFILLSPHPY